MGGIGELKEREEVVKELDKLDGVYYRLGVLNRYKYTNDIKYVKELVKVSTGGAYIYREENEYYISIPFDIEVY